MKIGYTEKEVSQMYFCKWLALFDAFKKMHNYEMKRVLFKEPEEKVSLLTL